MTQGGQKVTRHDPDFPGIIKAQQFAFAVRKAEEQKQTPKGKSARIEFLHTQITGHFPSIRKELSGVISVLTQTLQPQCLVLTLR